MIPVRKVLSQSNSKPHYDQWSVSQSVTVSSPIWNPKLHFCYSQTVAVLSMWDVLSDERMILSFTEVKMSSVFTTIHVGILHSQSVDKSPVLCGYLLFTVLHLALVYMYVHCIQDRGPQYTVWHIYFLVVMIYKGPTNPIVNPDPGSCH
jgi:hypothetical protein